MQKLRDTFARARSVKWRNWAAAAVAVFPLPFCYLALVEFVRMRSVSATLGYVWNHLDRMLLSYLALVLFVALVCIVTARPWIANLITGALLLAMGFANYYKLVYRGDPLVPKDIVQLAEATGIAEELRTPLTREIWVFLAVVLMSTLLLLPFRLPFVKSAKSLVARGLAAVLCAGMLPVYVLGYLGDKERMAGHGVSMRPASLADSYYTGSFLTSFLYLMANLWQTPPQGYNEEAMGELAQQVPPSGAKQVDVIVVLLESFYDLEKIEGLEFSQPLLSNYHARAQEGISGEMVGDKRGGGTSDYEFSVLTGFSTAMLPVGSVPYIEYIYEDFPGLPLYYRQNGYNTIALHPYQAKFYNREAAYPAMGFDTFLSEEDFGTEGRMGTYIGDETLGRRMIEEYERLTAQGERVFMHAVSMQNHTPYTAGLYPPEHAVRASSTLPGAGYDEELSTLATGIRDADAMIGMLTEYFSAVERDVVLLFYGDHQSGVILNGEAEIELAGGTSAYRQADEGERFLMTHTTPYLMWANFAQKGLDGGVLAPYMLAALMIEQYGIDGPDWFMWLAGTRPVLGGSIGGWVIDPEGGVREAPDERQQQILYEQEMFQYDIMFGKRYSYDALYS